MFLEQPLTIMLIKDAPKHFPEFSERVGSNGVIDFLKPLILSLDEELEHVDAFLCGM